MMMWRRGKTLGRGASAMVSLAEVVSQPEPSDIGDGQNFRLLPSVMAVKSAKVSESRSLRRETRLLKEFEGCPYVLGCFGADITTENGQQVYNILLEYASGGSLADRVQRSSGGGGLPEREARQYTKSVLMGLTYIHKQGYVHCDIKPHNILLVESLMSLNIGKRKRGVDQETTSAKIADLGLAKKAGQKPRKSKLRGTPLYIVPESILGNEYEPPVDIWALGCTLLQMITGKQPWKCDCNTEAVSILYRIASTDQVPEIPSWLSKEAQDFLNKCLVRDPKLRWTADTLLGHPFVDGTIKAEAVKDSSTHHHHHHHLQSSSLHLPKPYLLMSHSASDVTIVSGEHSEELQSQISFQHVLCKKRKSLEEEDDDAEENWQRSGISFQLNGLRRIPRIAVIPISSTASIEIFN